MIRKSKDRKHEKQDKMLNNDLVVPATLISPVDRCTQLHAMCK